MEVFTTWRAVQLSVYNPEAIEHKLIHPSFVLYISMRTSSNSGLFNKETVIHSDSYKKILSASFYKIQDFNVIKRKKLLPKQNIENNTLIVFYNHYEMIIHSVFLKNGVFYTKDGLQPPREETNIFGIIRHYWDTKRIEVYKHSDDS